MMPAEKPLISVIMPCYNAQAFLREAVACVLDQTYPRVELVVVDDGSTDRSREILAGYGDRIVLLRQSNLGPYAARNAGLRAATGDFLAFLDADDYWSLDFLERLSEALAGSEAVLAYCGWQNIGATDRSNDPYVPPDYEEGNKLEALLQGASPWPIHAALIRRSAIETVGPFDVSLPSCMDYDLWLRLAVARTIVRVPEVLAFYRFHGTGQISSKEWVQARNVWLVKKKFVREHPEVIARLPGKRLRELIDGGLASRAYRAYWRRDLVSAHRIFRMLLRTGYWTLKDLRYVLPALLPEAAYRGLISLADRGKR
jgi:glycosyltransferase involved in cell wall biosynthesis